MGERGWITRDSGSGNIELGPRVAWLARSTPASALTAGFHGVARGSCSDNETTCLTMLDGSESVFIAKQETTHPVRLVTSVGSRLPGVRLSVGPGDARGPARGPRSRPCTAARSSPPPRVGTWVDAGNLLYILWTARRLGYAENVDETALGLHCIAVPVGPPGRVAGAITLCVPSGA